MPRRATLTEQMAQEHSIPGHPRKANMFDDGASPFEQDAVDQNDKIDDENSVPSYAPMNTEAAANDDSMADADASTNSDSTPDIDVQQPDLIDLVAQYGALNIGKELEEELLEADGSGSTTAKKSIQHDQRALKSASAKLRETSNAVLNNYADQLRVVDYVTGKCKKYLELYQSAKKENKSLREEVIQLRGVSNALDGSDAARTLDTARSQEPAEQRPASRMEAQQEHLGAGESDMGAGPPRKRSRHSFESNDVQSAVIHGTLPDRTRSIDMEQNAGQPSERTGSEATTLLQQSSVPTGH
jgi:hypothetical protein